MSFNIGETVGPYRIIEQLGQGGMATVFKAYHAALDRYVALKVLHPAFHEDKTFIARFQREARVVARLEHPNIVPIYDYAEHENRPYLVMKFIEGETLKARLGRGPLTSAEIAKVVDSTGSALAYAHQQGILHRDIKPSNVLIAGDGSMYLADFGLARIAQAGESTLSSDSIMGTPQYISPEQAMGKKDLDEGTDIYSFGIMLYEMVVGQVPFSADTPFSIIHDHIYTPLPLPMEVNPKVPEPVQRVLLKSLAKDRADRYQSVQEMLKAFQEAWLEAGVPMAGTAITMHPTVLRKVGEKAEKAEPAAKTVAAKSVTQKKRSPWLYAAGGTVFVLCCLFAIAAFWQGGLLPNNRPTPSVIPLRATEVSKPQTPEPKLTIEPKPTLNATPADISPEVQAARQLVLNNPNDPEAHLQLALALWDAGQQRAALEELSQAANLADPSKPKFFINAAEQFKQREEWVAAAGMYLRAVQPLPAGEVPDDLFDQLSEAVYKASASPDMPLFIFFERIDRVDQPLGFIARGRNSLYKNDFEAANLYLENAKRLKPQYYEAFLLEAEIDIKTGHSDEARAILLSLSSALDAPKWIRLMAESLLKSLP